MSETHHEFPKALLIALWIILVLIPVLEPNARASLYVHFFSVAHCVLSSERLRWTRWRCGGVPRFRDGEVGGVNVGESIDHGRVRPKWSPDRRLDHA